MNKVILIGRLTRDPEVRNTANQVSVCNFTLAVDRRFKDTNGQRQADFVNCVAWRQTANFIGSYFHKGSKIAIVGSIQSRTYDDQQGQKHYVTEVVVDEAEFCESSQRNGNEGGFGSPAPATNYSAPAPAPVVQAPVAPTTQIAPAPDTSSFEETEGSDVLPFDF